MRFRLLLLLCVFSLYGFSQKGSSKGSQKNAQKEAQDTIPAVIQQAFDKEYPDTKIRAWEKSGANYVAVTKIDGQNAMAHFSPDGNWIETVFEVEEKELPGRISNYLSDNYPTYQISMSKYFESKNRGAFYDIKVNKKGSNEAAAEFFFDVSGNLMKKNEFFPLDAAISSSTKQDTERRAKDEAEKQAYQEARARLLAMDRTVSSDELPKKVKDNFGKKFTKAESVRWDSLDNVFTAYFTQLEMPVKADFAPNGDWLATYEDITGMAIYRQVDDYLAENHSSQKTKFAERVTRRDKNNYFYVELIPKKKQANPPVTRLTFDKNGKLSKQEDPVVEAAPDTQGDEEEIAETEDDRFEQKLLKEEEGGRKSRKSSSDKISDKELPSPVILYVTDNFPKEYKIKEAYFGDFPEGDNAYRVIVSKDGVAQKQFRLYFTSAGKFIEGDDPPEMKEKKSPPVVKEEKPRPDPEKRPAPKPKNRKQGDAPPDPGDIDDVPDNVKKSFSRKFPKAENPYWQVDEGKFIVEFMQNEFKNTVTFIPDGNAEITKTEMDPELLMNPIKRHIEDNYKGFKMRYAERVTRKDRKNYFYVEIYTRKKNVNPSEVQLYFDTTGRLKKDAPEE